MPWTSKDVDRHHKGLSPSQKSTWAKIANNALLHYGDEGKAIRIANAAVNKGKKHG